MRKFTSKLHIGKIKTDQTENKDDLPQDEPPPYKTFAPSYPAPSYPAPVQQPLPKQNSSDQKPKQVPIENRPLAEPSSRRQSRMPGDGFSSIDERRPHKKATNPDSDSDISEAGGAMKQVARRDETPPPKPSKSRGRDKSRAKSRSRRDDSDGEPELSQEDSDYGGKKSKQMTRRTKETTATATKREKSKSRAKSRRRKEESEDSDEEIIVKKTIRKRALATTDLDPGFAQLLVDVFEIKLNKLLKWCEKDWIKWDNKTNQYDISRILEDAEDDERRNYEKHYKKYKDEWQRPSEKAESSARGGRSRRPPSPDSLDDYAPMYVTDPYHHGHHHGRHDDRYVCGDRPNPYFDTTCNDCAMGRRYCGDPYHDEGF